MKEHIVVASSVAGYSHIKHNIPNQDSYSYLEDEERGIIVIVVSDGAGSAKNAKLGSSLCCQNLTQSILQITQQTIDAKINAYLFDTKIIECIAQHISHISSLSTNISSYNHTLSVVIFSPYGGKIIQIGDSPVVIINKTTQDVDFSERLSNSMIYDEEKQEGYANQTIFLTSYKNWFQHLRISTITPQEIDAILVMTDGAGSIFIDKPNKKLHTPSLIYLLEQFNNDEYVDVSLTKFISLEEIDNITGDDKTVVLMFPTHWMRKNATYSNDYCTNNIISTKKEEELKIKMPIPIDDSSCKTSEQTELNDMPVSQKENVRIDYRKDVDEHREIKKNSHKTLLISIVLLIICLIQLFVFYLISENKEEIRVYQTKIDLIEEKLKTQTNLEMQSNLKKEDMKVNQNDNVSYEPSPLEVNLDTSKNETHPEVSKVPEEKMLTIPQEETDKNSKK